MLTLLIAAAHAATPCPYVGDAVTVDACPLGMLGGEGVCLVAVRFDGEGLRHDEVQGACPETLRERSLAAIGAWRMRRTRPGAVTVGFVLRYGDAGVAVEGVPPVDPRYPPPFPPPDVVTGGVLGGEIGGPKTLHHTEIDAKRSPPPPYPAEASGLGPVTCKTELHVDARGAVTSVTPQAPCPEAFHGVLRETLSTWRYKPHRDGPVRFVVPVTLTPAAPPGAPAP